MVIIIISMIHMVIRIMISSRSVTHTSNSIINIMFVSLLYHFWYDHPCHDYYYYYWVLIINTNTTTIIPIVVIVNIDQYELLVIHIVQCWILFNMIGYYHLVLNNTK